MKRIVACFLITLLVSFLLISCSKEESTSEIQLDATVLAIGSTSDGATKIETETLNLVNVYRVSLGLNALIEIKMMSVQAALHTDYVIEEGKISHDYFGKRANYLINNIPAESIGENVAAGFTSAKSVLNAWLNSPAHRSIIENSRYTHTGISIKTDTVGKYYFVQLFAVK
ncbi:MAG: hypothetical protein COB98_11975 [Flavobacteriaceae bacterium]|nr:MAG: hypothetical protein COB98_11975 [Flavobacteriaceae bacterium]